VTARQRYDGAISNLLGKLCVEWGFCGNAKDEPFDRARTSWTAEEFAFEVLRAEGMDPLMIEGVGPSQSEYFKMIRARFSEDFGPAISVEDFTEEGAARRLAQLGGSDTTASVPRRRRHR
jgi:hypothetical protein